MKIISNMTVIVTEIKPHQSNNALMKLNHNWKTSQIILKNLYMENSINNSNWLYFFQCKDNDEERVMHSKSVNIEIMSHDKADEAFEKLFFTHSFLEFFKPPTPSRQLYGISDFL